MSELLSMLVPFETLPGWPDVASPSPLHMLGLLIGLPVLFIALVVLLGHWHPLARAGRGESETAAPEPLWLAAGATPVDPAELGGGESAPAALTGGEEKIEVGGASARW